MDNNKFFHTEKMELRLRHTEPRKGLLVSIYRNADGVDSSHRGLSSYSEFTQALLVGKDIPEVFEATDTTPIFELIRDERWTSNNRPANIFVVPDGWWSSKGMFGGNFIYSSDARFRYLSVDGGPLRIHDRME